MNNEKMTKLYLVMRKIYTVLMCVSVFGTIITSIYMPDTWIVSALSMGCAYSAGGAMGWDIMYRRALSK